MQNNYNLDLHVVTLVITEIIIIHFVQNLINKK